MKIVNKIVWWNKAKKVRVHVVEKADFTNSRQATALLNAKLPVEEFLGRPEVWGRIHKNGIFHRKQDYVRLRTGDDIVSANEKLDGRETEPDILFELADEPELFEVEDGKYVQDLHKPEDFYNLPAGTSTFTGDSARARYRLMQKAKEAGHLIWELNQNPIRLWFSKYWGFAFLTLSLIISTCVLIFGILL